MKVQKGDQFRLANTNHKYEAVGKWHKDIIMAPVFTDDEECLIYTPDEIEELVEASKLILTRRYIK